MVEKNRRPSSFLFWTTQKILLNEVRDQNVRRQHKKVTHPCVNGNNRASQQQKTSFASREATHCSHPSPTLPLSFLPSPPCRPMEKLQRLLPAKVLRGWKHLWVSSVDSDAECRQQQHRHGEVSSSGPCASPLLDSGNSRPHHVAERRRRKKKLSPVWCQKLFFLFLRRRRWYQIS